MAWKNYSNGLIQKDDVTDELRIVGSTLGEYASISGGGALDFATFDNDDIDVDGNITYTLGVGSAIVAVRIDQVIGGIDKVKNLWPSYEDGLIYGFDKLTSPDTQTIKVFLSGTGTAPPTPTTAELTVVVNGLPDGFEIVVGGETWTDNKKTFPIGTVLTDFTPTATGYTFDPLSIGSITMDMDKTVTFDATADEPLVLADVVPFLGTVTSSSIGWNWSAVPNATNYTVDRATNAGFTTGVTLGIYSSATPGFVDTGLSAITTYYYRFNATASGYTGSTSSVVSGATSAAVGVTPLAFTFGSIDSPIVYDAGANSYRMNTGSDGDWGHFMSGASKSLAIGSDGSIYFTITSPNVYAIAFNPTNASTFYGNMKVGIRVQPSNNLEIYDNGVLVTGQTWVSGRDYRLNRSSGVWKLQYTTDAWATFTDQYTFGFTNSTIMYPVASLPEVAANTGYLINPRETGLI